MHHWNPTNLNLFFVNNCGEGCTIEFTKEIDFIQVCIDMELNGNFWWTVSLVGKQESKKRKKKK